MEDKKVEEANPAVVENAWSLTPQPFNKGDMKHPLLEDSSFAVLFPKYREEYLKTGWPIVEKKLEHYGIRAALDVIEGTMTVSTTRETWDPTMILKARDLVKLLARSVPMEHALRVLQDDISYDIIKIGTVVRKKSRFLKRRQRLIGPNGCTLKSIELLTGCYVLVQGNTVAVVGPYKGLPDVRKIVMDTMHNVHPIYNIKTLMVKRELEKNEKLRNEDWSRFLPKYSGQSAPKSKAPKSLKAKKPYTPFPPAKPDSKVDKQLQSGEYFLKEDEVRQNWLRKKMERQAEAEKRRQGKREEAYIAPQETSVSSYSERPQSSSDIDVAALKGKVKRANKLKNKANKHKNKPIS